MKVQPSPPDISLDGVEWDRFEKNRSIFDKILLSLLQLHTAFVLSIARQAQEPTGSDTANSPLPKQ
jgi:hypothetical protein